MKTKTECALMSASVLLLLNPWPATASTLLANAIGSNRSVGGQISVGTNSNVCVSVQADQQLWPRPLTDETARSLSGGLMAALRRVYLDRGGSFNLPSGEQRFVTNSGGTTPSCQDPETDVLIHLRYRPRANGKPFTIQYKISRGSVQVQGSLEVDVDEQIRSGAIKGYTQRRTNEVIIAEDVRRRAAMVLGLLDLNLADGQA